MANATLRAAPTASDCDRIDEMVSRLGVREVLSMVEEACRGNAYALRRVGRTAHAEQWDARADVVLDATARV